MLKFKIKKRGHFKDSTLILIVAAALFFQTLLICLVLNQRNIDGYQNNIQQSLEKASVNDDHTMNNIYGLVATIATDYDTISLLQREGNDTGKLASLCQRLRRYKSIITSVNSVYLYSDMKKQVYNMFSSITPIENLRNEGLKNELLKDASQRNPFIILKAEDTLNNGSLLYIFQIEQDTNDAIIIELNYDEIQNQYMQCQKETSGNLVITDDIGNVIYGGGTYSVASNIANEELYKMKEIGESSFIKHINNEKVICTYLYSENTKRWFISMISYDNIKVKGYSGRQLIYICISILLSVMIVLRVNVWFEKIRQNIFIKFSNEQSKKKLHETILEDNKMIVYDYISNPLLNSQINLNQYLSDNFKIDKKMAILIINIDKYKAVYEKYSLRDLKLYSYGINNICTEICNTEFLCMELYHKDGVYYFLVGNIEEDCFHDSYYSIAAKCIESVGEYIDTEISCFISGCNTVSELCHCYQQVNEVATYKFLYGDSVILDETVINSYCEEITKETKAYFEDIKQSLRKNMKNEEEILNRLINLCYKFKVEQIQEIFTGLIFTIHSELESLKAKGEVGNIFEISNMLTEIGNASNIKELENMILYVFEKTADQRNIIENNNDNTMINSCMKIINNEFDNVDLNTEYIATKLNLSANYLGRTVKQYTGRTVLEMITEQRLNNAAKMLVETEENVTVIMKKVGFSNNSYFATVFRKKYGVTPTEYRKCNKI